ncbi:MAG: T9SS C-terminal target domain-containing protein [Bacteroidetes bacterium]|nr:MAG: T9SS C-terminal target domain-containing protein [Bacteroidota bacterium]REK33284.1 MAG: T9SS C-terminal target domain-containing protein [Bacteroidota bacterium]REK49684.1 MAG: T9SS C-terminal target domain-containing protein [Bacteroidota bacterium]
MKMLTKCSFQRKTSFHIAVLSSMLLTMSSVIKPANATHMAGADLTYQNIGIGQYIVTYTFYRDCIGIPAQTTIGLTVSSAMCNMNLNFTMTQVPGTGQEITHTCPSAVTTCNGGSAPGIQKWEYRDTITLPAQCNDWILGVSACCRNAAITTLPNPDSYNMYIQAHLNNMVTDNNSPIFTNIPIAFMCINQNNYYNHGVLDIDGDSLVYSFVNPLSTRTTPVQYNPGYSVSNPITSVPPVALNGLSGDVFMHPVTPEIGVIAVLVEEYRNGVLIGSTMRDIQIYTIQCNNNLPVASGINGTNIFEAYVCAENELCFDIFTSDIDVGDSLTIWWNQGIPGASLTHVPDRRPVGTFCWTPGQNHVRSLPYTFIVSVRDDACPSNGVQSYAYLVYVSAMSVTVNSSPSVSCFGAHDGWARAVPVGTGPFDYYWMPGELTGSRISHLEGGTYSVTIVDGRGCVASRTFTITEPPLLTVSTSGVNAGCGSQPGSVSAIPSGGTTPYMYSWNTVPVQNTQTASGLGPGSYNVLVTDRNGCSASASQSISAAVPFNLNMSTTPAACLVANGTASANVSGGSGNFSYTWTPAVSTNSSASGLLSGNYSVLVEDLIHGCINSASAYVGNTSGIVATIVSSTNANCQDGEDGTALAMGSGGTPPYFYRWSPNGDSTAYISNLAPGVHTVEVTDYLGCPGYATVSIGYNYTTPALDLGPDTVLCLGQSYILNAGAGFSSYTWSNGSTGQTLIVNNPGNYSVLIRDGNGCENFDAVQVSYISCQSSRSLPVRLTYVELFPNPAGELLSLNFRNYPAGNCRMFVYDSSGRMILESNLELSGNDQKELNVSVLQPGIYVLLLQSSSESKMLKFIRN